MKTNRLRVLKLALGLVVLATLAGAAHPASNPPPQCQPDPGFTHCTRVPLKAVLQNSCNNFQWVALQGYFHYMTKTTADPVAGTITFYSRQNWQDVKGVSVLDASGDPDPTPTNYSASNTMKDEAQVFALTEEPLRIEQHANNNLISHGTEPNQIIHFKILTVFDPAPVVDIQGPGLKCTG